MKRIETTIGYREEYDNGEIRYFSGWSGQGYVYKDNDAFEKKEGVVYIREAMFEHANEDYGRDYVTPEQIESECDYCTYKQIMGEVRWYFKGDDAVERKPWAEKFYEAVCQTVFNIVDWQGVDIVLDEMDWNHDIEYFSTKFGSITIYVLSFLDLQHYGFGTKDVYVSRDRKKLERMMRDAFIEKAKAEFGISEEDALSGYDNVQYSEGNYAYIDQFYYWDIFEREV